jgi:hypothetical protein
MVEIDTSEIAEVEVHFVLDNRGNWGFGLSGDDAAESLWNDSGDGIARRHFSIRVRARKPGLELGPEIDIADRDTEVATASEGKTVVTILSDEPEYAAAQRGTLTLSAEAQLPHPSRASHSS